MPSQRNQQILEEITQRLSDKQLVVTVRYSNVSATQMNDLRREVRNAGGNIYIAKNNLVAIAAHNIGLQGIETIIDGPTAYITSKEDISAAVKALSNAIKAQDLNIQILGGFMEQQMIAASRVQQLADMPSREQLIATLAASLNSPINRLARVMNAPVQNLASILSQIADQRKSQEDPA